MRLLASDVEHAIDCTPINAAQLRAMALCASISLLDGFDVQAIAFVAPDLMGRWNLPAASLGLLFTASIVGAALGAFLLGPLADRFGPKRLLVTSVLIFAAFTAVTGLATGPVGLIVLRILAGLGMGGAVPAFLSLLASYSPRRARATVVTLGACCQVLGAALGGAISAYLIPHFGWQSVFLLGGALPLVLLPFLLRLPENPLFLTNVESAPEHVRASLARLGKHVESSAGTIGEVAPKPWRRRQPLASLFADGRAAMSVAFIAAGFFGVAFFYFLANWVPTILRAEGASLQQAVLGGAALNAGGFVGAVMFARLMDKSRPFPVVYLGFLAAGLIVPAVGHGEPLLVSVALLFLAGFGGLGAIYSTGALAILSYPPRLHGTALGIGIAAGRVGSIIAPLLGSALLLFGAAAHHLFYIAAIAGLAASFGYWRMSRAVV